MRLRVGTVLGCSYRLLEPIGEGGMSHVWVAEQLALERRVAIKVLTDGVIRTAAGLELFQREARATARVDHPHVVRILDFDVTEDGTPYLALELLVGETLEQRLARGAVDLHEARAIVTQACDALAFAHECGVLHRDIKAGNLFLQRARSGAIDLKLLDFGIALTKSRPLVYDPGVVGTPAYMSPEQLAGHDVDERCDLFSLAVCIYYALTSAYPYPGDTPGEAARSLEQGTFTRVSALRPDLPPALDDWFSRALATDRDARFQDAHAMAEAFERACQASRDTPVAVDVSHAPRTSKRSLPWGTAFAVVAAAAVFATVRVMHRHPRNVAHAAPRPTVTAPAVTAPAVVATAKPPPPAVTVPPVDEAPAVPVETLPVTKPTKNVVFRFVPKQPPPALRDAGSDAKPAETAETADGIPEFGTRE